jgi:hypothetical protein
VRLSSGLDLSGGLSNQFFGDLLQCLTSPRSDQGRIRERPKAGWPDGRRAFGTVSTAVIRVLTAAGSEMKVKAIRDEVERLLGDEVSRFSVSDYLLKNSKGPRRLFDRTRQGHYKLARE